MEGLFARLEFWTISSDLISLFTVLSCAIRLPTYYTCDVTFRKELRWMFFNCFRRMGLKKPVKTAVEPKNSEAIAQKTNITSIRQLLLAQKMKETLNQASLGK